MELELDILDITDNLFIGWNLGKLDTYINLIFNLYNNKQINDIYDTLGPKFILYKQFKIDFDKAIYKYKEILECKKKILEESRNGYR